MKVAERVKGKPSSPNGKMDEGTAGSAPTTLLGPHDSPSISNLGHLLSTVLREVAFFNKPGSACEMCPFGPYETPCYSRNTEVLRLPG